MQRQTSRRLLHIILGAPLEMYNIRGRSTTGGTVEIRIGKFETGCEAGQIVPNNLGDDTCLIHSGAVAEPSSSKRRGPITRQPMLDRDPSCSGGVTRRLEL